MLQNLHKDANVGVDPCCISIDTAHRWEQAFSKNGQKLVALKENLVDKVWENRPAHVVAPVCIQPLEFAGRPAKEKIHDLRGKLVQEKAYAFVVTTLDEVGLCYCSFSDESYFIIFFLFMLPCNVSTWKLLFSLQTLF